jgi:acyl-CoA reductase-like NAD-dependent aldehyde dehydrogenase
MPVKPTARHADYGNFIGGEWAEPRSGRYFQNFSPVNGKPLCEIARSNEQDIEAALDAAHAAKDAWGRTSVAERAIILNKIADRMEDNLDLLALAECSRHPRCFERRSLRGAVPCHDGAIGNSNS